ncbi:MAG: carbohydrate ABC transporter substrate-binding protein [Lachnospiraceae bacterium]|nr:carbohydrate ABC transporter substrate-binding protein [Lachnospiraceae bacterium]
MRKAVSLVLAGVMAFSLVGCSSSNDKKDGKEVTTTLPAEVQKDLEDQKVTLKVVTTYAGNDSNAQIYQDAYKAWEAKSGNTVEDGSVTADESFKEKVITDFQVGEEPDVLFYFNGKDSDAFVSQGKVMSIDEIRAEYPDYAKNMKDDMMGASPVDGKNYSVPVNGYWEAMFVNKNVLKAAGVDVPDATTTWTDFIDICQKIKDAGYSPIAASLAHIPHYWFEYSIYNHTSPATHNAVPAKADDDQGKAWAAGLDDIKALYEKGFFPDNTLTATDDETFQLFATDKAAFLIDGNWKIGDITKSVEDIANVTVTYVPGSVADRKTTDMIGGISMGYYITKKAWDDPAKRKAAVDFVSHMTSDEVVSQFAGVSATALVNGATVDESTLNSLQIDAVALCKGATGISPAVQDNLSEAARVPIFGNMAAIVKGEKTSADAVKEVLDIIADETK